MHMAGRGSRAEVRSASGSEVPSESMKPQRQELSKLVGKLTDVFSHQQRNFEKVAGHKSFSFFRALPIDWSKARVTRPSHQNTNSINRRNFLEPALGKRTVLGLHQTRATG